MLVWRLFYLFPIYSDEESVDCEVEGVFFKLK